VKRPADEAPQAGKSQRDAMVKSTIVALPPWPANAEAEASRSAITFFTAAELSYRMIALLFSKCVSL
jgi:hypothetical protein